MILSLAYFLERKLCNKPINKNIIYFFVALTIGAIILVAAPGNYKRLDVLAGPKDISLLENIYFMWQSLIGGYYTKILRYIFVTLILLTILDRNIKIKSAVIYLIALTVSLFVLTPIIREYGSINQRMLMIYYAIFFLSFTKLAFCNTNIFVRRFIEILSRLFWLLGICLIFILYLAFSAYISLYKYENQRLTLINNYHQCRVKNVKFPVNLAKYTDEGYRFIYFDDITFNKNDWRNKSFAKYYNFDSVSLASN